MSLIDAALIVSALAALAGAAARNVTAAALLGSFVFSEALCKLGVPFNFVFWVVIDLVVIVFIVRPDMKRRDAAILALFLPIWGFYLLQPEGWSEGVAWLVCVQMLACLPDPRPLGRRIAKFNRTFDPWNHFDLRIAEKLHGSA